MRLLGVLAMCGVVAAGSVAAMDASPRPEPRPAGDTEVEVEVVARAAGPAIGGSDGLRPLPRPVRYLEARALTRGQDPDLALTTLAVLAVTAIPPKPAVLPEPAEPEVAEIVPVAFVPAARPEPRPILAPPAPKIIEVASASVIRRAPRPDARPENLKRRSIVRAAGVRVQPGPQVRYARKGGVCGDRSIRGANVSPIAGKLSGCGVAAPVRVTEIDGVVLSQASLMDCQTAAALKAWIQNGVRPAVGRLGGGVKALKVAAHYSCRTRNNKPGAKISEHGKGRAIDISAVILENDVAIDVLKGWRDPAKGKMLREMHKAACGPFGTVLGPGADRYHQDHFHFDTARHRGGAYCR